MFNTEIDSQVLAEMKAKAAAGMAIVRANEREQEAKEQLAEQIALERTQAASKVTTRPVEPVEAVYVKPVKIPCPVCGSSILPTQGFHSLPELGEYMYCINSETKALRAGLNAHVVSENLRRQEQARKNKG